MLVPKRSAVEKLESFLVSEETENGEALVEGPTRAVFLTLTELRDLCQLAKAATAIHQGKVNTRGWTTGAPYVKGSDTSKAAAQSIQKGAKAMREHIFSFLARRGAHGATCDEVEAALGYAHQTASPRIHDLEKASRVVDSGQRRRTRSGRFARVLVTATPGS